MTYYTLFVLDLRTRRVHVAGSTPHPDDAFMAQAARDLTAAVDGIRNELIAPESGQNDGTNVCCRERLGGLLLYYHRAA